MGEVYTVADQSAFTEADKLLEEFFFHFGVVLTAIRGKKNFEVQVSGEMCISLGIHKTCTRPLHPQSDGLVESFNHTLAAQLAILVSEHKKC